MRFEIRKRKNSEGRYGKFQFLLWVCFLSIPASLYHWSIDLSFPKVVGPKEIAYKHSFGLLDDVDNKEWERIRKKVHTQSIYKNPENPLERVEESQYWLENNIIPNFDCPHNIQVGGQNLEDGVKFVCNPHRLIHEDKKDCLVYSVGCAGNYIFEDGIYEMHKGKCEIHVFDPAPNWGRRNDPTVKNIHYHPWGFKSSYDTESKSVVWPKGRGGGFKTIQETMKELGHEGKKIDIFKIDCEGCEYTGYLDWIGLGFGQILVETHDVPTPVGKQKSRWFQKPLDLSVYYGDYTKNGYALYNRDVHGKGLELAYVKLHEDFWKKA